MDRFTYKINIPYKFIKGNSFYNTTLTIEEFSINDVNIKLDISDKDDEMSYVIATANIEKDGINDIESIADVKIGETIQLFFDGITKGFENRAFFNIFNGSTFLVNYEVDCQNMGTKSPGLNYNGFKLDDNIVLKAIDFAKCKEDYIKQAFMFLKEGEYFIDIGRIGSAIIQFAIMSEYLINYQLRKYGIKNSNGKFIKKYEQECKANYKKIEPEDKCVPFAYSHYIYGLSKIGLKIDDDLINIIDIVYKIRNKLAHGNGLYHSFKLCKITFGEEEINEYNIEELMYRIGIFMEQLYNFFEDNFANE